MAGQGEGKIRKRATLRAVHRVLAIVGFLGTDFLVSADMSENPPSQTVRNIKLTVARQESMAEQSGKCQCQESHQYRRARQFDH